MEYRWAERTDQFPAIAVELVGLGLDVIVAAGGTQSVLAAKWATSTTPIVFTGASDPVQSGLITSLSPAGWQCHWPQRSRSAGAGSAAPDAAGDRTTVFAGSLSLDERVEHNARTSPKRRRLPRHSGCSSRGCQCADLMSFRGAFEAIRRKHAEALSVAGSPLIVAQRDAIIVFATEVGLPCFVPGPDLRRGGGLSLRTSQTGGPSLGGRPLMLTRSCKAPSGGPSRRAAHHLRLGDQPQDRTGPRADCSPVDPAAGHRGHPISGRASLLSHPLAQRQTPSNDGGSGPDFVKRVRRSASSFETASWCDRLHSAAPAACVMLRQVPRAASMSAVRLNRHGGRPGARTSDADTPQHR